MTLTHRTRGVRHERRDRVDKGSDIRQTSTPKGRKPDL